MNRININNYEAFILDFLEGKLSQELREELLRFSILHPELQLDLDTPLPELKNSLEYFPNKQNLHREFSKDEEQILSYLENDLSQKEKSEIEERRIIDPLFNRELQAFEKTRLKAESTPLFPEIHRLHKTEEEFILNNRVLRYLEKDLAPKEEQAFDIELLTNKPLKLEYSRFLKTRLTAEADLLFPDKHSLYKKNKIRTIFHSRMYYAAAAVILLLISLLPLVRVMMPSDPLRNTVSTAEKPPKHIRPKTDPVQAITQTFKKQGVPASKILPVLTETTTSMTENLQEENKTQTNPPLVAVDTLKSVQPTDNNSKNEILASSASSNSISPGEQYVKLDFSHMIPFEEEEEEEEGTTSEPKPAKGFWQKATRLARQVNKLGLKTVDGNEVNNNHYLISFNTMSIEKK